MTGDSVLNGEPSGVDTIWIGHKGIFWQYLGIPSAIYGPTSFNMGAPDEYILEKEFEQVLKIHALTIIDYLCAETIF